MNNENNIIQLTAPAKKESVRPEDPKIIIPTNPKEQVLVPFPDGVLLRFSPKGPNSPHDEQLVHDSTGYVVAIAKDKSIAGLITTAIHLYVQAAKQNAKAQSATIDVPAEVTPVATPEVSND